MTEDEEMCRFWKALGDPVRMEILSLLRTRDFLNVGDIAANFHISRPAISHHLKVLREVGAVQSDKAGQEVNYRLSATAVVKRLRELADLMEQAQAE